jgi:hypothetical protein
MQKGTYVHLQSLRKGQRCGTLPTEEILLHYGLGEPMFVEAGVVREGRLIQDIREGGRVHLDLNRPDGTDIRNHFLSHAVIAVEGDVVATEKGFFRVTAVTPSANSPDLPSHLRALNRPALSGGMINFFSRANYPLWMNLIVSRFPLIFLDPNPNIFGGPDPILSAIDPRDRVNLRCGFECREGWAGLIEEIAATGTDLVKVLRESGQPDAAIYSKIVKAKLGSLRWSGDATLKEPFRTLWSGYVLSVCARSTCVCEVCGKHGKLREIQGWREVLCDVDYARVRGPQRPNQG